jgi:thioredoxin reductase
MKEHEVIVIGGGQSGLATGYYLRRYGIDFTILDDRSGPGAAWRETWDSLRLFSPASASSLPGWPMPATEALYPTRDETIEYLRRYEERYELPVERPVHVEKVERGEDGFLLHCDDGTRKTRSLVAATGTWSEPYTPEEYQGQERFQGIQVHSAHYRGPEPFRGKRTIVVGAGNSGAQILAELSGVTETLWVTRKEPEFLPDEVDGRVLFQEASKLYQARRKGNKESSGTVFDLGSIVVTPSVKKAREQGNMEAVRPFERIEADRVVWPDGSAYEAGGIVWCTGFKPALSPFRKLDIFDPEGKVAVHKNASTRIPELYFVGYGNWTGFASATLIGVGRTARRVAQQIKERRRDKKG